MKSFIHSSCIHSYIYIYIFKFKFLLQKCFNPRGYVTHSISSNRIELAPQDYNVHIWGTSEQTQIKRSKGPKEKTLGAKGTREKKPAVLPHNVHPRGKLYNKGHRAPARCPQQTGTTAPKPSPPHMVTTDMKTTEKRESSHIITLKIF